MAKKARKNEIEAAPPPRKPAARKRKIGASTSAKGKPAARKRKRKRGGASTSATGKPAARKMKRGASTSATGATGMCDNDVIRSIFARLPTCTVVASMVLSQQHRRMILCPEFRSLHCRLGPPLPQPHIAYLATAKVSWGYQRAPVSGFHCFDVAGNGIGIRCDVPKCSLAGGTYLNTKYVNTCNGVLLLAGLPRANTCMLWNPCVTNCEKEVIVPISASDDRVLGLDYGRRSGTYKLLLLRRCKDNPCYDQYPKDLLVYVLQEQPQLRTVLSAKQDAESLFAKTDANDSEMLISSLYIDGTIYLLHVKERVVLAFDVDREIATTINLPGNGHIPKPWLDVSRLMEASGRPCVEMNDWHHRTLWLLTVDHQWEKRFVIKRECDYHHQQSLDDCTLAGVWDCGGVLLIYFHRVLRGLDKLYLFNSSTMTMFRADLPYHMKQDLSDSAFCWGYKPTLVSPGSIVGELSQDEERCRDRAMDIMATLKPVIEMEKIKGQETALRTVCFMNFLASIMQKLPGNMQDVIEMPLLNTDPDLLFKNAIQY